MSVNAIASGLTGLDSMLDYLNQTNEEDSTSQNTAELRQLAAENRLSASARKAGKNAYALSATSAVGQAAISRALSEMAGTVEGPITFSKIAEYRKSLESSFTRDIKADLLALGVDPNVDFTLSMTAEGQVSVQCADPASKAAITAYLNKNPERCDTFGYIQALGNLERAKQAGDAWKGAAYTKAQIGAASLENFFSETAGAGIMDYAAMTASFGADQGVASFFTGLDFTV